MPYWDRLQLDRPKRLLAIDGGGIRGALSLEILANIEVTLRRELGAGDDFVLADYFDYIGGCSSGAIIATGLACGMKIDELRVLYATRGAEMFDRAFIARKFHYQYRSDRLEAMLKSVFGADTTFGDERIRTLLMVVMRNATTDSPWPLSNNPRGKYNDPNRSDSNLMLPLWQLVRASTAAPTYFPPEHIALGSNDFVFMDGGITMYNNPAFQLFLMATLDVYQVGWPVGEQNLLLVSVGSGTHARANKFLAPSQMNLLFSAHSVPAALMLAASAEQDALCRIFGRSRHVPYPIDREMGDLMSSSGLIEPRMLSYLRYNADLSPAGLQNMGFPDIHPEHVQLMDSIEHIGDLQRVGMRTGQQVKADHFNGFLQPGTSPVS